MSADSPIDTEFSVSEVPSTHRRGFWPMLVVMLGFTFFSASMWSGGKLGLGLSFGEFLLAVLGGNLVLGAYTAALAHAAAREHVSASRFRRSR